MVRAGSMAMAQVQGVTDTVLAEIMVTADMPSTSRPDALEKG